MSNRMLENLLTSRVVTMALICIAATLAGLGTFKLYLPSQASWALSGLPIIIAAILEIRRSGWLKPIPSLKAAAPLLLFLGCIALAVVTNDLPYRDVAFSAITIAKLATTWGFLLLLIQSRMDLRTLEFAFAITMLV